MIFKVGDKVYPFRKTVESSKSFENSHIWINAKERNQKYLYVVGVRESFYILNSERDRAGNGDYFNESDLKPYLNKYKLKALLKCK